jgi:ribonuclease/clavin/mitogillin
MKPEAYLVAAPGVNVLPLRTPTLPPAEATNTVILGPACGDGPRWIVDPATPHADERARLLDVLASTPDLAGIALTHHHRDHLGAAAWLARELSLPVAAHASTSRLAAGLGVGLEVSIALVEDDCLGDWRVLHTPGHASDHLCFVSDRGRVAVVGDMVASVGSILIDPGDGHMKTYLKELQRLEVLGLDVAIPAHGGAIARPSDLFAAYRRHRLHRASRVARALGDRPRTVADITAEGWSEVHPSLMPLAARSCIAHLESLMEDGKASPEPSAASPAFDGRPWLDPSTTWRASPEGPQ